MRYYKITLSRQDNSVGSRTVLDALNAYVPKKKDTLQDARKIRNAIKLLFGNSVNVEIRSMDDRVI